jgi:hypothetical protein
MSTTRTPAVLLALCLTASSAWLWADTDADEHRVDADTNQRVQEAIAERNDVVLQPNVICTRESVVGSHFKRKVCRTAAQIEQDRADAEDIIGEANRIDASSQSYEGDSMSTMMRMPSGDR